MKKAFVLIMVLGLFFGLCSCKKAEPPQNNTSIESNTDEYKPTLICNLTGTENLDNISDFIIGDTYGNEPIEITNKNDLDFIKKYTYTGELPQNELHELFKFPDTKTASLKANGGEKSFYILSDGRIAIKTMCGDSGVPESERTYDIYTADYEYNLTEERLIELLKKYDGYK